MAVKVSFMVWILTTLKMEVIHSSEMLVTTCESAWCHSQKKTTIKEKYFPIVENYVKTKEYKIMYLRLFALFYFLL
jgi:hypothetical protein